MSSVRTSSLTELIYYIAVSIACRADRKGDYLASHSPFKLDRLVFVDKAKLLEDLDPLLILWDKFQVLFRNCILQCGYL